jgi:hypothetical protein
MLQLDFKKLVLWLLPPQLRKSNTLLLLLAWTMPIRSLYDSFQRFLADKLYRLNHNSQVCYLRAVLNDQFDRFNRRIQIVDFVGKQRIYFWPESDKRDVDFSITKYFWADADYADSGVDFTVLIPANVATTPGEMARIRSFIDEYKLAGKNYNIVYE